jgi:putative colanic acid biosynthesis UDP-glucose lipid carrier transferase
MSTGPLTRRRRLTYTSLRKRVQFDLYYITHWTPWFDLRILWLTVFHGLFHRNAY